MNNREFLYSLDPHALTEWFESEHFECPTNGGEASMMSVDAFIAEHTPNDTLCAKKVVSGDGVNANDANAASLRVMSDDTQNVTDDRETAGTPNKSGENVTDSRDAKNSVTGAVVDDNDANVSTHVDNQNDTLDGAREVLDVKFAELTAKCYELQAQVDELTEQRDRWRDNWNRRNVAYSELVNEYEELRDEKTKLESTLDVILDALADYWLPDER